MATVQVTWCLGDNPLEIKSTVADIVSEREIISILAKRNRVDKKQINIVGYVNTPQKGKR